MQIRGRAGSSVDDRIASSSRCGRASAPRRHHVGRPSPRARAAQKRASTISKRSWPPTGRSATPTSTRTSQRLPAGDQAGARRAARGRERDPGANREETLKADPRLPRQAAGARHGAAAHQGAAGASIGRRQRRSASTRAGSKPRRSSSRSSRRWIASTSLGEARYADLPRVSASAQIAEDVARKQGGERFSVLYPASLPTEPIEPQPLRIMADRRWSPASCSAPRAALGREFLDRSVHDARALQNEFEVPVLGEIPRITV